MTYYIYIIALVNSAYFISYNKLLLTDFTDNDIKKLFEVWNESDGTRYPKLCVKAISEPIAPNLKALGKEVSLDRAKAGDFCQLWRASGSAHNAIIVDKIYDGVKIIGLKYYSSNPVPNPQTNKTGIGLIIEKFTDAGGTRLRDFTYYAQLGENVTLLPAREVSLVQNPYSQNTLETIDEGKKKRR